MYGCMSTKSRKNERNKQRRWIKEIWYIHIHMFMHICMYKSKTRRTFFISMFVWVWRSEWKNRWFSAHYKYVHIYIYKCSRLGPLALVLFLPLVFKENGVGFIQICIYVGSISPIVTHRQYVSPYIIVRSFHFLILKYIYNIRSTF